MGRPGVYESKIVDYGVMKTKADKPMVMIRFLYADESGTDQYINWYGGFSTEISAEITCKSLATCGWTTNNPADLAKGKGSGVLDEKRFLSITLANEEYNGKTSLKVKYINPPGGDGFRNKMSQADAVKMFAGMNLGGTAAKARAGQKKEIPNMAPGAKTDDDTMPF